MKIKGIDASMLPLSAGVMAFRTQWSAIPYTMLSALLAGFVLHKTGFSLKASCYAALFALGVHRFLRVFLPTMLHIRVVDILRCQMAFSILTAASTVAVARSAIVTSALAAGGKGALAEPFCFLLVLLAVQHYVLLGWRWLLLLAVALVGGLCARGPIGAFAIAGLFGTWFFLYIKLARNVRRAGLDGSLGDDYLESIEGVSSRFSFDSSLRFRATAAFVVGAFAGALAPSCFGTHHLLFDANHLEASAKILLGAIKDDYVHSFRLLATPESFIHFVTAFLAILFTTYFFWRETDVMRHMSGFAFVFYGCVVIFTIAHLRGYLGWVPFLNSAYAGVPAILADAFCLLLATAAFVVEIGCRGRDVEDDRERRSTRPRSRMTGRIESVLLALFVLFVICR